MLLYLLDALAAACALACLKSWLSWRKRRVYALPYPPGPKGLPFIGNVLDMPPAEEWETVRQWGGKYGSLVLIKNFGKPYLFLNTYQAAVDLFEKRGHNYSSRPDNTMLELEGFSAWFPSVMPYNDELKKARQYLHRFLQKPVLNNYFELQTKSMRKLLLGLLKAPENYSALVKHCAGETIMMFTYGFQIAENDDHYIDISDKGMEFFSHAQGFFLVNAIPWLQYLPSWFPGAGFKKIAEEGFKASMAMYQEPYHAAKKLLNDGSAVPSMTSKLIDTKTNEAGELEEEELIMKCTGIAYGGGADTTVSVIHTFILAMTLFPEYQKRAQDELDRVVGKDNLPTFEDRPSLPFINALCKEALRWQIVGPWGVAHCATEDDVYEGYFIPAGTTVLSNLWAMTRDPKIYSDPDEFIPDRWIPSEKKQLPMDVSKIVFGIGRRICPGRHFADNALFIAVASILSAFNISKALDEDGVPITPKVDYIPYFIRHPKPFKCKITPRSSNIESVIRQVVESAS
ncbi:hypothetical protein M0805_002462 [Coniferiporia weirii]|nr:hypothetical protein M0805_002462 [Coniferiporia weirii]